VKAVGVLQDFYTNRTVVGIDCTDLVWGLGAIHCVSQQQPFTDRIYSA
ncbi:agmatine deiminase family protein, partial [bacterium]|nr:agmatine deiminase family protein [bacterium]